MPAARETTSQAGGSGSGDVKTGPGVTADTITIGQLTDLTGVFAPLATAFTQAQELYFSEQEPVCGRKVKLVTKDTAYDVQKSVSLYRDLEPDVAALSQVVGSPTIAALLPSLRAGQHARGRRGVAAGVPRRRERRHRRRDLRPRGDQRHRVADGEQGPQEGRRHRRPLLRGRLRRGRPDRREVRRREARPQGGRAEDQGHRRGHVGGGGQVQARGRQGHLGHDRPDAARLASRASPSRSGSTCRSGRTARSSARSSSTRRSARRSTRTSRCSTAAPSYAADNPEVKQDRGAVRGEVPEGRPAAGRDHGLDRGPDHARGAQEGVREQGPLARGHREGVPRAVGGSTRAASSRARSTSRRSGRPRRRPCTRTTSTRAPRAA